MHKYEEKLGVFKTEKLYQVHDAWQWKEIFTYTKLWFDTHISRNNNNNNFELKYLMMWPITLDILISFPLCRYLTSLILYYELFWSIKASWPRIAVTIISLCVPWYHDIREKYSKVKISHTKALNMDIMFKIFWYVILSHE